MPLLAAPLSHLGSDSPMGTDAQTERLNIVGIPELTDSQYWQLAIIMIMLIVIIVFLMITILVWPRSTRDPWTSNRGTLESPLHWISHNMIIWCWCWWWWWSWRCFIQWRQWWWQRWPRPSKIRSLSQPTNTAFLLHLPHSQDHTLPYHFPISIPYIFVSMISFNFYKISL